MTTYLITGSNRGIGLEYCRQLAARGDDVIATCRNSSDELEKLGVRIVSNVDVTSDDSVRDLAAQLAGQRLDVLINNAGILTAESWDHLDLEAIMRQFEVNAVAPLRITKALIDLMPAGGRIAIMTSLMGSLADNTSGGYYGYRMSKVAVSMAGVSLARDLKSGGIAVAILHPWMVATDMTGHQGITAEQSVQGLLARIDGLTLENSGTFWNYNGDILPW